MSARAIVTSFSKAGFDRYGKRFIDSFRANCLEPLWVYSEDRVALPPDMQLQNLGPTGYGDFVKRWGRFPSAQGLIGFKNDRPVADYRLQAVKFAAKVFAIADLAEKTDSDWLVWIDADVEVTKPFDKTFWKAVLPADKLFSYLGRTAWSHSECGFVAYRIGHPVPRAFLKRFREIYASGEVFRFPEWHDSHVFDRVREEYSAWVPFFNNISHGIEEMHPWPHTILGEYMVHNKGPQAKKEAYG